MKAYCCGCGAEYQIEDSVCDELGNGYCSEECRDKSLKWRPIARDCQALWFVISAKDIPAICLRGGGCNRPELNCPLKSDRKWGDNIKLREVFTKELILVAILYGIAVVLAHDYYRISTTKIVGVSISGYIVYLERKDIKEYLIKLKNKVEFKTE